MASKPTQRTLSELKSLGFTTHIVEHFNPWVKRRQDCMGFGDVLACREGIGVMLIQTTSGSNLAARITKICAEPRAAAWLKAGGRIEAWGWSKRCERDDAGKRLKRKTWQLRRHEVTLDMIAV